MKNGKQEGVYFAVWAPHAESVSVVGEFNDWDVEANPMVREEPLGIYTLGQTKIQAYLYNLTNPFTEINEKSVGFLR